MADVVPGGSPDQAALPQPAGSQPAQGSADPGSTPPGAPGAAEVDPPTEAAVLSEAMGTVLAVAEAHGGHYRSQRAIEAMKGVQR